ncbi:hypothetical protein C6P77_18535 [Burkholderia ambifaria]|nr:hypothetical protein C6P77_18535 [Burkholderia ambifaria]
MRLAPLSAVLSAVKWAVRSAQQWVARWAPLRGRPSVKQSAMLLAATPAIPAIARATTVPAMARMAAMVGAMAEETAAVTNR